MDWTMIERMWRQAKGRIQSKWDKLTNEDLELIAGRRERLEAKIRHLYGFSPEQVRKEVDDWLVGRWSSGHAVSANWGGLHMPAFDEPLRRPFAHLSRKKHSMGACTPMETVLLYAIQ